MRTTIPKNSDTSLQSITKTVIISTLIKEYFQETYQ